MDQMLSDNPREADWGEGAERLRRFGQRRFAAAARPYNDPFAADLRDPMRRLVGAELFLRTSFAKASTPGPALAELSHAAVHLLDTPLLDEVIWRTTGRRPSSDARRMIIYHGGEGARRSLLVLDPELPTFAGPVIVDSGAVAMAAFESHPEAAMRALSLVDLDFAPDVVAELLAITRPRVVIAPAPPMEYACVPDPPWCAHTDGEVSTVGALVRDAAGRRGVTVCHHGAGPVGTKVRLSEGDAEFESEVALASPLMDTCFVPIGDNWRPAGLAARAGMLSRRAPGAAEAHRFKGASSGGRATRIVGTDMGVPFPSPGRQLCVHTSPDLDYGDSGAALVNEDDRLVGFAFQRTPFGSPSPMAFASWIWAASALDELQLTLEET